MLAMTSKEPVCVSCSSLWLMVRLELAGLCPATPRPAPSMEPGLASEPTRVTDLGNDLVKHIASLEVLLCLRTSCRHFRASLPEFTTAHANQPLPEAFLQYYSQPEILYSMPLAQRRQILCFMAAAGSLAGLRRLPVGPGGPTQLGTAGRTLDQAVMEAAAGAGQAAMCGLLGELGCGACGSAAAGQQCASCCAVATRIAAPLQ